MAQMTLAAAALTLGLTGAAMAQETLTAAQSDPVAMGWMQGFPPPADKTIRFTDPDYFAFPKLRWTVCNFRALMPNAGVAKGAFAARDLLQALNPALDDVSFTPTGGDGPMTWGQAFDANYTDGVVVLHHGRIVYERYAGCLDETTLHGGMSVTKSLTGLLAEMLVAEGALDDTAMVGDLIPELKDSAFGDATVRQVMNMTTALDYSKDYADPDAEVWTYAQAGSPLPKPEGYDGPDSYFSFLETVKAAGTHGEAFGYKTVNADAVGWLIARSTDQSVADLLSDRIWSRIGAEREAFYTVDSIGTPFAGGGFNATLHDMGRLGQLMLDDGQVDGEQIVPKDAIARIRAGGDPDVFAKGGYEDLPGWSYGGLWWVTNDDHGAYAARGVHGQTLWIDPKADMVIARFASHPVAANAANDPTSLPAYRAVADYLIAHDDAPLLGTEWIIEDIAAKGVIDTAQATLKFLPDGRVTGNASCNRLTGRYDLDGDAISFMQIATTRMACPEAVMNQENALMQLLPQVGTMRIDEHGGLILATPGGVTVTARR